MSLREERMSLAEPVRREREIKTGRVMLIWEKAGIVLAWAILFAFLAIWAPHFLARINQTSIIRETAFNAIAAIGMTFVIMSGHFDISIGSMLATIGMVTASVALAAGFWPAVACALLLGLFIGTVNGLLIAKMKIPAFIVTLGMLWILRAVAYIWTNNNPVEVQSKSYIWLGNGKIVGIPMPVIVMLVLFGLGYLLLRRTALGRYILAVGSNSRAAYISGVNVDVVKIAVFAMMGFFVGVVALLLTGRMYSASPNLGIGWEFQVIAIVVLGGTSLKGGSGSLLGTFFAALFFATINNGMNLLHVDAYWQYVAVGVVLLAAVALDGLRGRLSGAEKSG